MTHMQIFEYAVIVTYIIYATNIFGITFIAPEYIEYIHNFIHIYIAIFLLWKFRPPFLGGQDNVTIRQFDRRITFHAGVAMLFSSFVMNTFIGKINYLNDVQLSDKMNL